MKYPSFLLHDLARSIDTAELDGTEAEVGLHPNLIPVIVLPRAIERFAAFSATDIQRKSFITQNRLGVAASAAAAELLICTFAQGLWEVVVLCHFLATYTQILSGTTTTEGSIRVRDPAAIDQLLFNPFAVNAVPHVDRGRFRWLFAEDSYQLVAVIGATGVGETQEIRWTVSASLLL